MSAARPRPSLHVRNFLVGTSKQLAHAAAQEVARGASGAALNPLFVHASVGLGKTHLLQAIAHRATELRRRVVYLTAEKFMYGFVSSLKDQTTIAFKERLRTIDLLIIDDVQFLQGKIHAARIQPHWNALFDAGRQVVVAADAPRRNLRTTTNGCAHGFRAACVSKFKSFDDELRLQDSSKIASAAARAAQPGFDVPPAVISYVANVIQTNGRDIEGAVNRLLAHNDLAGARLTAESAEAAISDLIRVRDPKRVKIDDILKLVAVHYNVSRPDLLSSRRTAMVVKPRQVAMYLAKVLTPRSLPRLAVVSVGAITRPFSCRPQDRTSVEAGPFAQGRDRIAEAHAQRIAVLVKASQTAGHSTVLSFIGPPKIYRRSLLASGTRHQALCRGFAGLTVNIRPARPRPDKSPCPR